MFPFVTFFHSSYRTCCPELGTVSNRFPSFHRLACADSQLDFFQSLDARTMIATPGQHIDTSGWGQKNPNVHTTTGQDLLNNSPTSIDDGLGPVIPDQPNPPVVSTGSGISRRPDGTIIGSPTGFPDQPNPPVVSTGSGISRRPDGTIIGSPTGFPDRPIFLPNNVVPTGFSDFGTFYNTFRYSQQSFLNVVSQWQTPGFSINLVRSQFSLWINQLFQTVSLFQGGCGICDPRYAGQFQALATNLLRDIQYALQIIRFQYGSLWGQFSSKPIR
ncbi:uncharacterized protein MELLADRAFT_71327 [Melampsora larici-populina 98AG31]|uniref:Uncharacterized protein n=1 Tax=Melampsora larici-populina (strain 98AG31 / pathotype 3-4-7) TaxID=747676 RepID=F4RF38_MELLP|nr:uncharacterized protein MELLADRAFT_71327 [Melampsora larici-populina 98AG31]EGG08749.1 hypothetical protein MELLADRAFT_71327 [Melampsora larici-populina 98AG31]